MISRLGVALLSLLTVLILFGCSREEVLVIDGASELLEAPYPMNYPSSSPKPNRVMRILKDQTVMILQERVEKDYVVYKIETDDGERGYVLAKSNTHKQN